MIRNLIAIFFLTGCSSILPTTEVEKSPLDRAPAVTEIIPTCSCAEDYPKRTQLTAEDFKRCQDEWKISDVGHCFDKVTSTPQSNRIIPTVWATQGVYKYNPVKNRKECVAVLKAIKECQEDIQEGAAWTRFLYSL